MNKPQDRPWRAEPTVTQEHYAVVPDGVLYHTVAGDPVFWYWDTDLRAYIRPTPAAAGGGYVASVRYEDEGASEHFGKDQLGEALNWLRESLDHIYEHWIK